MEKENKKLNTIDEDLTKSDVSAEINNKINSSSFKNLIKSICADVLSDMYKTMWQKKSFWKGDVTR